MLDFSTKNDDFVCTHRYAIRLAFPGNESVSGSDGSSCDGGHTLGQLFQAGRLLTELSGARKDFHCKCTGKPGQFYQ